MTGYGTRDVARVLGCSPSQIRSYVRAGLLAPRRDPAGRYRFSFPDLVLLRTARGLAEARVPQRRIRRALRRLAQERPLDRGLSDLSIAAEGTRIVVREGAVCWDPQSGQTFLDFEPCQNPTPVATLAREAPAGPADPTSADDWHRLADELEASSPDEARRAYERALAIDSERADSHVNLGRLLHEQGDVEGALAHYRAGLEASPGDATAVFNQGVALEDLGRLREALAAYERAIALNPADADAYFNAANLADRLRETAAALGHWKGYRKLTRSGV
jgi:tetratricopeptide (TPR) repeat protein